MPNIHAILKPKSEEEIKASMNKPSFIHAAFNAANVDDINMIKKLIKYGFDVNMQDSDGWALIHYASHSGNLEIVELLLKKGAKVNIKTNSGKTPLKLALKDKDRFRHIFTVDLLLKNEAIE